MPDGGALTLATRSAGDTFEVRICDTGVGMTPETAEKIFTPFFTTKERGTGLGLMMVHNIVQAHKGTIHAISTEGKGSTFVLILPLGSVPSECPRTEICATISGGAQDMNRSLSVTEK